MLLFATVAGLASHYSPALASWTSDVQTLEMIQSGRWMKTVLMSVSCRVQCVSVSKCLFERMCMWPCIWTLLILFNPLPVSRPGLSSCQWTIYIVSLIFEPRKWASTNVFGLTAHPGSSYIIRQAFLCQGKRLPSFSYFNDTFNL